MLTSRTRDGEIIMEKEINQFKEAAVSYEGYMPPDRLRKADALSNLAEIMLFDDGIIKSCNKAGAELLGCKPNTLVLEHVSRILPQLGEIALIKGDRVNPYLRFLSRVGHRFEVVGIGGARFLSALFFNDIECFNHHYLRIIFQPVTNPSLN